MGTRNTVIQKILTKPIQLPPLTKNIHVLMQALAEENMSYKQLAEVIKHYPEITARLIFLVNSPWSAPVSPINSIEQACARLGVSVVKSISIAISIASSFDTGKCPSFDTEYFWTSSILVAEGASQLASLIPGRLISIEYINTAQTAGILHNLGLLWMANNFPVETNLALQAYSDNPTAASVNDLLRQYTGTDYCEIGGLVAKQMELPEALIVTMEQHVNDEYQDAAWEIARLVGSAANMASALHKQVEEGLVYSRLEKLGLDSAAQTQIFQQLLKNLEKTRELVKTLFSG